MQKKFFPFLFAGLILFFGLGLSACLPDKLNPFQAESQAKAPAPSQPKPEPLPILPLRILRPDGSELSPGAFQALLQDYAYVIVDGDPQIPAQREAQIEILNSLRQSPQVQQKPLRRPSLAFAILSAGNNQDYALADSSSRIMPGVLHLSEPEDWERGADILAALYRPLLAAAEDDFGHLPLRGLALPSSTYRKLRSGEALNPEERHLLPPAIVPMPEDLQRLQEALAQKPGEARPRLNSAKDAAEKEFLNRVNSALAWAAIELGQKEEAWPLFIVLTQSHFDQGLGLAEALDYFDPQHPALQLIIVAGQTKALKNSRGEVQYQVQPLEALPGIGGLPGSGARYLFAVTPSPN